MKKLVIFGCLLAAAAVLAVLHYLFPGQTADAGALTMFLAGPVSPFSRKSIAEDYNRTAELQKEAEQAEKDWKDFECALRRGAFFAALSASF